MFDNIRVVEVSEYEVSDNRMGFAYNRMSWLIIVSYRENRMTGGNNSVCDTYGPW